MHPPDSPPESPDDPTTQEQSGSKEGDDEPELTEAEVLGLLAPIASRLASALGRVPGVKAEVLEVLRGDRGAVELMAAAFDSGREEAKRELEMSILRGADPTASGEPDWSDVESPGERKVIAREQSICGRCIHVDVCRFAPPAEMLVVIRRCAAFAER